MIKKKDYQKPWFRSAPPLTPTRHWAKASIGSMSASIVNVFFISIFIKIGCKGTTLFLVS